MPDAGKAAERLNDDAVAVAAFAYTAADDPAASAKRAERIIRVYR